MNLNNIFSTILLKSQDKNDIQIGQLVDRTCMEAFFFAIRL